MTQNSPANSTNPFEGDDLLTALAQANPVSDRDLPSASAPEAQSLLEAVMSQTSNSEIDLEQSPPIFKDVSTMSTQDSFNEQDKPNTAPPAQPNLRPAATVAPLAPVPDASTPLIDDTVSQLPASGSRRGRGLLVAAAAAVVLVALAALTLVPITTSSAAAEVASAAAATDATRSGRIDSTFSLVGSETIEGGDVDEVSVAGAVSMLYRGDDLRLSLELDDLPFDDADADDILSAANDIRLIDGVVYVKPEGEWLSIDTNGLFNEMITDQIDPREVLANLQELTEATEVGSATLDGALDGLAVTHYQSVVDLGDEAVPASGWTPFDELNGNVDGEITIDTFVDDDGLVRRVTVTGNLEDPQAASNGAVFEIETDFTDLGEDVTIEAPAGAIEFSPGLMGSMVEEGSA